MQSPFAGVVSFTVDPMHTDRQRTDQLHSSDCPSLEPVREITGVLNHEGELAAEPRYQRYVFHSTFLPDDRNITVYVPPQYTEERKRSFPVFYLHDGQNLFDGRTSYIPGETWKAHTTADQLARAGLIEPVILVGIANTGVRRVDEYTPTRDARHGGGEGERYGRLLVEELKPLIDLRYHTLAGPENTAVGGSSLGGLISLWLGWQYPRVFGKLAVMSPSIWWDGASVLRVVDRAGERPKLKIWLDVGTAEGERNVQETDALERALKKRGWRPGVDLAYCRAEGAEHNERAWAERFGDVLRFLFPAR